MTGMAGLDPITAAALRGGPLLVTGSAGYIGSAIRQAIEREGIACVAADVRSDNAAERVDLCDDAEVSRLLGDVDPRFVIHCAAASALDYRERMLDCARRDMSILSNVLAALRPEARLVYISSSYVYSGIRSAVPLDEDTPLRPEHNFGLAKLFFEQLVRRTHPNSVAFRLCSVFGGGRGTFPNAIHGFAEEAVRDRKVTVWGEGKRMMQYVFLPDVVRHIAAGARIPAGVYNLGGGEYVSVAETAARIASIFGVEVAREPNRREGEMLPFLDTTRLTQAAGFEFTPLDQAIREHLAAAPSEARA